MLDRNAALYIDGLHTQYGNRNVLKGVNLIVEANSIYGLLGRNGAGKTTLIRSICGRVKPAKGAIHVNGIPNTNAQALHKIGLVPQDIALYSHLTVKENLEVFGRLSGLSRKDMKNAVDWVYHAAHLDGRMNDRIDILSGGWKRRVNIAAAILHSPALLILDEPTVGVDIDARNGLHELILELSQAGMGILLTTHDMEQAETLCSEVGFLFDGVVAPQGHPQQLLDEIYHDYKEVILELRTPPTANQFGSLKAYGLSPFNGNLSWSKFEPLQDVSANQMTRNFQSMGLFVREVRVRDPGLDSLFVHLTQDHGDQQFEGAR